MLYYIKKRLGGITPLPLMVNIQIVPEIIDVEYALGGSSNQSFASKYVLYMPNKEQLIAQVEAVLKKWHKEDKPE